MNDYECKRGFKVSNRTMNKHTEKILFKIYMHALDKLWLYVGLCVE